MNDDEKTIDALRRVRFTATPLLDARVLRDATSAMRTPRSDWRRRVLPRAVAATLMIGAAVGVVEYLSHPALTMAQVQQAFIAQTWVHVVYDNGREQWTNLIDGRAFFKDFDGRTVYTEPNGLRLWYWPKGSTISKDKWFSGSDEPPPSPSPVDVWRQMFEPPAAANATQPTTSPASDRFVPTFSTERHDDAIDGRSLVRFDQYETDILGRRLLVRQMWADPKSRLPVQERDVLVLGEREEQKRDAIVGRYSFPTTGPTSLADLGVPAGLTVIDAEAKPADDVAAIVAKAKAAKARFPQRYRLVDWPASDVASREIDVIYRDGIRRSRQRWLLNVQADAGAFDAKNPTLEQVLAWTSNHLPAPFTTIADGERSYSRSDPIPGFVGQPARASVRVMPYFDYLNDDDINFPPGAQWFFSQMSHASTRVVHDVEGVPAGVVVLRSEAGNTRTDFWIDTLRDFICVRDETAERVDDRWRPTRIHRLDDLAPLPTGQWFARKNTVESYGITGKYDPKAHVTSLLIDLRTFELADFPPGAFDGSALMKDADVETR